MLGFVGYRTSQDEGRDVQFLGIQDLPWKGTYDPLRVRGRWSSCGSVRVGKALHPFRLQDLPVRPTPLAPPPSLHTDCHGCIRFVTSKEESLFLQRKNPRKIAWTVVFRRVNKKGVTEELAKKRSRKTVKHQRGIVGADLSAILAKRNQKPEVRDAQRWVTLHTSIA